MTLNCHNFVRLKSFKYPETICLQFDQKIFKTINYNFKNMRIKKEKEI